jgi:prepilin-type N-terminal cleavage/methylation domain-containing protein
MKTVIRRQYRSRRRAFTLAELMVVILIIGILVAILIPALNAVRLNARKTVTRANIGTLSTGLETFRADQTVGGKYPPSASDWRNESTGISWVKNPYQDLGGSMGTPRIEISGAGLLVWALAGADLLGTPGFRAFRSNVQDWAQDTDNTENNGAAGAYALDQNSREPLRPRVGPFVDLGSVPVSRWSDSDMSFVVPREADVSESLGRARAPQRRYPMFLDSFGQPVLYWRADPAGVRAADNNPLQLSGPERGIYHFVDNAGLLQPRRGSDDPLLLSVNPPPGETSGTLAQHGHVLTMGDSATGGFPADVKPSDVLNNEQQSFARHILDRDVTARAQPQNADTFLLLSAGPDGIFGTTDDIANFEPNGGKP